MIEQGTARAEQAVQEAAQRAAEAAQSAEQARAASDRMIQQAIQDAERAVERAGSAVPAPPPPPSPPGNGPIIFTNDNGRSVSISMKDGNLVLSQEGSTQVIPFRNAIPREAVQIAWAIPATLSILLIWWPLSRAVIGWIRRKQTADGQAAQLQQQFNERFSTLERNIDTVAVEMERLAEGQRFTTKLLAERETRVPAASQP